MRFLSPIHHTFAPHATPGYCLQALGLFLRPWTYVRGKHREKLREALARHFGCDAFLFASGREALFALLKTMKLKAGEEVIVQAYTCVVVPNAIHAAGGSSVYADIDRETLNLTVESVRAVLSPRTRAVICQHTFGISADLHGLRALSDERGIMLIEDCAHVIPEKILPGSPGSTGDHVLLSFGRDKAISGVSGGAVLTRTPITAQELRILERHAGELGWFRSARYLLYPLLYAVAKLLYGIGMGKLILKVASLLGLLERVVSASETAGHMSPLLHRIPNACAALGLSQLHHLRSINEHRRSLSQFYLRASAERGWPVLHGIHGSDPLQKFPMFISGAESIRKQLKEKNIHLDDGWTGCVVCPPRTSLEGANYVPGSDPVAEESCERILCLPTHPSMTINQAKRLIRILEEELRSKNYEVRKQPDDHQP